MEASSRAAEHIRLFARQTLVRQAEQAFGVRVAQPLEIGGQGAGQILKPYATPEAWAGAITDMVSDPDAYGLLCDAALDRAATTLSWTAWAEGIVQLAQSVGAETIAPASPLKAVS